MKPPVFLLAVCLTVLPVLAGQAASVAVNAINALGIDLLHKTAGTNANTLLSPYSIQMAMAMTYAGAEGQTREEMARVLHFPADGAPVDDAFAALQTDLAGMMQRQADQAQAMQRYGMTNEPLTLTTANRLFGQQGYGFRPSYLSLLKNQYLAPLETFDFIHDALGATTHINTWVADQTHDRIQNLIPPGALTQYTRLVLVNAIYLKAAWETEFAVRATQPRLFYSADGNPAPVPTMFVKHSFGYARRNGYQAVVLPYAGGDLQFVVLLPDATNGLASLEAGLTPAALASCAMLPETEMELYLPKFELEPPALSLSSAMQSLGMNTAFDIPQDSANFDRMAPRRPDDYLYISAIFHKTFLKLDEQGTEAAAATAVVIARALFMRGPGALPLQVRVDHPFLFAIEQRETGACLFLGHVTDPR